MNDSSKADEAPTAVLPLVQKERLCDEFEAAWRSGDRPEIEAFLARAVPSCRDKLLLALLEIELESRARANESLSVQQYRERFPAAADRVETIFHSVVGRRRVGDYELLEELGRGGMGVVYRARQVLLNQIVAVKVLPERFLDTPTALARFRREMQSIGALDHPNVVRAYNAGEADGAHFLAMEYVDGMDLKALIVVRRVRKVGPLSVAAAVEIIRQAATGLQYVSEKGLVHRDIKPANLMLSRRGVVKILDLGVAKLRNDCLPADGRSSWLTQADATIGTVDYMAPEQWEDPGAADIRADIYSLGCTLYYLLTGQVVYRAETVNKKIVAHRELPPPSLVEARADVPPALDAIFQQMLAKKPEQRQQSPSELLAQLSQLNLPRCKLAQPVAALSGAASAGRSVAQPAAGAASSEDNAARRAASLSRSNWIARHRKPAAMVCATVLLSVIAVFVAVKMHSSDGTPPVKWSQNPTGNSERSTAARSSETSAAATREPREAEAKPAAPDVPPAGPPPYALAPFNAIEAKEHQRAWAKYLNVPVVMANSIGLQLVLIPPGEYMMGAAAGDRYANDWERPQHHVRITKAFYLGMYAVTVGQFRQFAEAENFRTLAEESGLGGMHAAPHNGANDIPKDQSSLLVQNSSYTWKSPPFQQTAQHPVVLVTQGDTIAFCKWLSAKDHRKYRLPTEAEWEYACRAGTVTKYYWGDSEAYHASYANLADPSYKKEFSGIENSLTETDGYVYTAPVGSFRPNAFGLYDMLGNVSQRCSDSISDDYYAHSPTEDPRGPAPSGWFVARGSAYDHSGVAARCSARWRDNASQAYSDAGFRIVLEIGK